MKRLAFLLLLICIPLVMAGELQTLHRVLAKPSTAPQVEPPKVDIKTPGVTFAPNVQLPSPKIIDHGISEIGLERTRCLTSCPAYTLIIREDGSFRYTGEYAVDKMGDHTGKVSQGLLNQLLAFIAETNYFELEDTYSSAFLDSATSYTMVTQRGNTKVIENYANSGPATLWAIERLIDDLLASADWDN